MADIDDQSQTQDQPVQEDIKIEDTEEVKSETVEEEAVEEKEEVKEEVKEEEKIDADKIEIETRGAEEEKIDYGEDIDPEDVKTIGKIVEKQTESVKKQLQETRDRLEVDAFVSDKPEFAKYKPVILRYLQHPVYSKIPVKNIAAMVASSDLLKLGAQKERDAQAKASSVRPIGNAVRKAESEVTDWSKVSKDAFEAHKRKVLGQG